MVELLYKWLTESVYCCIDQLNINQLFSLEEFKAAEHDDEIKLELARAKEQREQYKKQIEQYKKQIEQYKKQREIIIKQEKTKREQYKKQREIIIKQNTAKRKEIELELLHQKEISKALKTKNFTEPIKQEIMSMLLELAKQAIQEEYAKKLAAEKNKNAQEGNVNA